MRRSITTLLPLLLAGATGCGAVGAAQEAVDPMTVRVLVRDINIRAAGVDCAGTGPYQHFHNRAPFRVLDPDGAALASGQLSAGTAVAAFAEDLGSSACPPTANSPSECGCRSGPPIGWRWTAALRST